MCSLAKKKKIKFYEDWSDWFISSKATQMINKNIIWLYKNQDDIFFKILKWQHIKPTRINSD
jgi:hypothetical protein